jgi:hypothetical protein
MTVALHPISQSRSLFPSSRAPDQDGNVLTDCYADAERFEIQGEEGIIQVTRCSDRMLDEPALTLYRDGEVRAFHNLDADWGASFRLSTRHFLDVLAGRESEEALNAQEGRRVIAFYDLFQRNNAERRALVG